MLAMVACQHTVAPVAPAAPTWDPTSMSGGEAERVGLVAVADPEDLGVDVQALDHLLWRAWDSRSDSLWISVDGQMLVQWPPEPEPIETMSMTKSLVSLGVGMLEHEGALSLDEPVSTWFDTQGPVGDITLRQLLEHTSGLAAPPSRELYAADDLVAFALSSELQSEPGAAWKYNNNASNLVAGIASKAAGEPLDGWLQARLWDPLGLPVIDWLHDPAGNVHGLAGVSMSARDLHTIGRMLLAGGVHDGQQLVPADFIARATTGTGPSGGAFGMQWWTARQTDGPCVIGPEVWAAWEQAGVDPSFLQAIAPLRDRDLGDGFFDAVRDALGGDDAALERWHSTTWKAGLPDCRRAEVVHGFRADGWIGQHLVVLPAAGIVAVRQRRATPGHGTYGTDDSDSFSDFPARVMALRR